MGKIMNVKYDLTKYEDVKAIIKKALLSDKLFCISTVNLEFVMLAQRNKEFKDYLNNISDLNTVDGVGILNVLSWYNITNSERVCGSDLVYTLAELCEILNKKYYILGAATDVSNNAKIKLKTLYPNLQIENYSPPFTKELNFSEKEDNKIKQQILAFKPDVLCVAFGAPKQELWIKNHYDFLLQNGVKIAIGLGGSFDFVSGKVKRAPDLFKKTGNEWLYRLITEPKLRFKRQISTIPLFYIFAFFEFLRNKIK